MALGAQCTAAKTLAVLLAASLMLSTHPLCAQQSSPRQIDAPTLAFAPATRAHRKPVSKELPDAPRNQIESPVTFPICHHYTVIDAQAAVNLQQSPGTTGKATSSWGSSLWLTSGYTTTGDATIKPADNWQHWARYVPWSSSIIPRVSQQVVAHPHVRTLLKILTPF